MESIDNNTENKVFRVNNNLCRFSPCGEYIAIAYQSNLIIKKMGTLGTLRTHEFADTIEFIEWSPDAQYILCASIKKVIVQLYAIYNPEWRCKLTEGSAGMERVTWAPDSNHIITSADFNIQISVWSLDAQSVTYIQNLKSLACNFAFSPNGKSLAVITSNDGIDSIEIYKTDGWKITRKLLCEKLNAIDGISWSPNSELLCMWCSISGHAKLLVYSTISDSHVGVYCPEEMDAPSNGPRGIDRVLWNPSGQLLTIAAHNEIIVLLNYVTWKPILELRCGPVITDTDYLGKVYREFTIDAVDSCMNFGRPEKLTIDEINERPINIPIATNANGKMYEPSIAAVDICVYSSCGRYLALRHQVYSSTMWIWDIAEDSVDHLLLKRPISGACWNPQSPRLIVFTEAPCIFEWRPERAATRHESPRGMTILSGEWHPRENILSLCGYNKTAIFHLPGSFS